MGSEPPSGGATAPLPLLSARHVQPISRGADRLVAPLFRGWPMDPRTLQQTLRPLIEPVVARLGFDVVAIEWVAGRRRPILRVSIDAAGGVGADDCAQVSHRLSPLLDAEDPISGAYDLEVSSPGMERPVQRLDDFRRFTGFSARVRLEEGLPRRRYTGILRGADAELLRVEVAGEVHELPMEAVESCHLVLDLDTYATLAEGLPPIPPAPSIGGATGTASEPTQEVHHDHE